MMDMNIGPPEAVDGDGHACAKTSLAELTSLKAALDEHAIVAMTDTAGKITYVNDKFCQISGYRRKELLGANHRILASGHHPRSFFSKMFKTIANGQSWHGEIKNQAKDGSTYWVETTITPFKDANGKVDQYIAIRADITSRKLAEEELINNRDQLQVMVSAATKALRAKTRALQKALAKEKQLGEIQRQFVSMASHEFRTPLAIIDAMAQRLKSRAGRNRLTPEDAISRVEKIRAAVSRMTRVMESTLALARCEDGEIQLNFGPCDIGTVLGEACERQQDLSATHVITCEVSGLPKTITADSGALEQVFANLLSNAVKYAPEAQNIVVSARVAKGQIEIAVRDHGIGIDADELKRIGDRFFRARTSAGIEGTGIGLSLVKHLVERHHGTVEVLSRVGEGSTFTIRLPVESSRRRDLPDTSNKSRAA